MDEAQKQINNDDIVHIRAAIIRDGKFTEPTPIGYKILDDAMMGGVREGDFVVITGKSGMGKTSYGQSISVNFSNTGNKCLWFSYEMIIDNLYAKFLQMGIKAENFFCYTPKQMTTGNIEWIQDKTREGLLKYNTKFIFIDHIDFLSPKKIKSTDQRRMIIQDICTELKSMAISLRITIFLMAHVKKVQGRSVEMQDLAESGSLYKLADFVFAVERESRIINENGVRKEVIGKISSVKILKNRLTGNLAEMEFKMNNNKIEQLSGCEVDDKIEIVDEAIKPIDAQRQLLLHK